MKEERKMGEGWMLRSPKKEEQQLVPEFHEKSGNNLEDINGFYGINDFDAKLEEDAQSCKLEDQFFGHNSNYGEHEFFGLDFFSEEISPNYENIRGESFNSVNDDTNINNNYNGYEKREKGKDLGSCSSGLLLWDDTNSNVMEETKARSLKLNLNYEEVLEAWSNRGSHWAQNHHHHHHQTSLFISNNTYMGEVPNLDEERTRRETSVLRYKLKRHNRLFAKKIRYEVRKVNADNRPRLKGRFVKRVSVSDDTTMCNG